MASAAATQSLKQPDESVDEVLEQVAQHFAKIHSVKEAGYRAQQVAQQIARSTLSGDVEDNLIQLYPEPQEIEIKRA